MPSLKRVFTLRLKDEYFDKLEVVVQKKHRSLTNLIELSVIKYLEEYESKNGSKYDFVTREIYSMNFELIR